MINKPTAIATYESIFQLKKYDNNDEIKTAVVEITSQNESIALAFKDKDFVNLDTFK